MHFRSAELGQDIVSSVDCQRIVSVPITQILQYQRQARIDEGQLVLLLNSGGFGGPKGAGTD